MTDVHHDITLIAVDYISGADYSDDEINGGLGWDDAEHEETYSKQMFKILTRPVRSFVYRVRLNDIKPPVCRN